MKTILDALKAKTVEIKSALPDYLSPEAKAALTLGMMKAGIQPVRFVEVPPEQKKDG